MFHTDISPLTGRLNQTMYLYLGNKYAKRGERGAVRFMRHQAPQSTRPIITMGRIKYVRSSSSRTQPFVPHLSHLLIHPFHPNPYLSHLFSTLWDNGEHSTRALIQDAQPYRFQLR